MSERVLRFPTIREITGLSRSTIWRKERDGTFPRHKKLSAQCVGWLSSEVTTWLQNRPSEDTLGALRASADRVDSSSTSQEKNHGGQ